MSILTVILAPVKQIPWIEEHDAELFVILEKGTVGPPQRKDGVTSEQCSSEASLLLNIEYHAVHCKKLKQVNGWMLLGLYY